MRIGRTAALLSLLALSGLAVAVGVLLSSGGESKTPRELLAAPPEQFGAGVNRLFNDGSWSSATIDSQLRALRATGATLARSDALWERAEPNPPVAGVTRFDWSFDDQIAGTLARQGLRWLPVIDYAPAWDGIVPGLHSAPRLAQPFARFAAAFAARYGRQGTFWRSHPELTGLPVLDYEIWNEPDNMEFWRPQPDAAAYAELYLQSAAAIAKVDPAATVVVGGLTRPGTFLPGMLAARPDLRGRLQAVAIHPYGATPEAVLAKVRQTRRTLTTLGLSHVPLYITEFGWTTHPPRALEYAPARLRPGYVQAIVSALGHTDCGIAAAVIYTWVTPERQLADKEDWFGLSAPSGGASADARAFAAGLRGAGESSVPVRPVCSS